MENLKSKLLRELTSVKFWSIVSLFGMYMSKQIDQTVFITGLLGIIGIREASDLATIIKAKKKWQTMFA